MFRLCIDGSRPQKFAARKARKYLAQKNRLILPALELAYVFAAIAHAPRKVVLERMIPHVHQALEELGVLVTSGVNGDAHLNRGKIKKAAEKNNRKTRTKVEGSEGYWDDLCLARFLEGVCWRFVAYPVCRSVLSAVDHIRFAAVALSRETNMLHLQDPDAVLDADETVSVSVEEAQHWAETAFEQVFENGHMIELDHYVVYYARGSHFPSFCPHAVT